MEKNHFREAAIDRRCPWETSTLMSNGVNRGVSTRIGKGGYCNVN